MLERRHRLAIFMEGAVSDVAGKMGSGVLRYSPNPVVCVIDSETAGRDAAEATGIPRNCPIVGSVEEAKALGAEVFLLGIAPPGGLIPQSWYPSIDRAVELGLSIVNGLHDLLGPRYRNLPEGQWVWDIRIEPPGLKPGVAEAARLGNRRVLMIGTDMSVGKMTAGLEIHAEALRRGLRSEFVATGQIGMTIMGSGVPLDAVRLDFACGAIEREVMRVQDAELIVVEGQGSLIHPGSTATLPLLRGSCPTHLVLCVRAKQDRLLRVPSVVIPPLRGFIRLYEDLAEACGTFPRPKTVAVAVNSPHLSESEARDWVRRLEDETGLPAADPVREGASRLLDAALA